jgi:TRAP-type uncharacterized transport system substrate-binding protein
MVRTCVCLVSLAIFALAASTVGAADFGTRDEAVAMVKRVQEKFKKDGPDATFAAITGKIHEFHDRDLYPYVLNFDCVVQAHGTRKELVGKSLYEFRDQDGKFVARDTVELAKTLGHGWTDFRWTNPQTGQVEAKSTYVERLGDHYAVGVGIYRDEQVNSNTVAIISGSPSSDATYLQVAYDLAAVLNDGENLRILPVVGIGGPQNIRDVRSLKGVDIGLTQISILNNFRHSNELLGVRDNKIVYITKLFNLEAHLLVRSDTTSLEQLQGKKVNLDELGSGTNYSIRDVFKRLGIKIEEVNMTQVEAIEKLKSGELAASVLVSGKPAPSMMRLRTSDGLSFLPIPYTKDLGANYLPATLTHADYPEIIPADQTVDTIADGAILIAYNWPKGTDHYQRVERFVNALFPRIAEFQKPPHHAKWREVNLSSALPGWTRFEPAEAWLNSNRPQPAFDRQRAQFNAFLDSRGFSDPQHATEDTDPHERLFEEFLRWSRGREARPASN